MKYTKKGEKNMTDDEIIEGILSQAGENSEIHIDMVRKYLEIALNLKEAVTSAKFEKMIDEKINKCPKAKKNCFGCKELTLLKSELKNKECRR